MGFGFPLVVNLSSRLNDSQLQKTLLKLPLASGMPTYFIPEYRQAIETFHYSPPPKVDICPDANFVVVRGTEICHDDNLWFYQWRQSCHCANCRISMTVSITNIIACCMIYVWHYDASRNAGVYKSMTLTTVVFNSNIPGKMSSIP